MEKWEYTIRYRLHSDKELNALGQQGWELVCVDNGNFYFKRKVKS